MLTGTMNWVIFSIFALVMGFNFYCSVKFLHLYRRRVVIEGGRISLAKLRRSLDLAKNDTDRKEITRFRRWYILYLVCFYLALLGTILSVIKARA
jgi:hypothetical protein